jgi:hypothetical protein
VVIVVGDGFCFGFLFLPSFLFGKIPARCKAALHSSFGSVLAFWCFWAVEAPSGKAINGVRTIRQCLGIPRRCRRALVMVSTRGWRFGFFVCFLVVEAPERKPSMECVRFDNARVLPGRRRRTLVW